MSESLMMYPADIVATANLKLQKPNKTQQLQQVNFKRNMVPKHQTQQAILMNRQYNTQLKEQKE